MEKVTAIVRDKARKAAALAEQYAPSDPEVDARLRQQAEEEEKIISRTCDELGVEIFEVSSVTSSFDEGAGCRLRFFRSPQTAIVSFQLLQTN